MEWGQGSWLLSSLPSAVPKSNIKHIAEYAGEGQGKEMTPFHLLSPLLYFIVVSCLPKGCAGGKGEL